MISVQKINDEVLVWCSRSEVVDIEQIRDVINTIKQIHKNKASGCKVIIRKSDKIRFNINGKAFYDKIMLSNLLENNNVFVEKEVPILEEIG